MNVLRWLPLALSILLVGSPAVCEVTVVPGLGAIQAAIDAATDGEIIVVTPGTYTENLEIGNRNIVLRSTDPTNPAVVASTVIDGGGQATVVSFGGQETPSCVLSGFTITNGYALEGGGGGINGRNTHAVIRRNVIVGNVAELNTGSGGGLYCCYGLIEGNIIHHNRSKIGGAMGGCQGDIRNNIIYANVAETCGGIGGNESGAIVNNTIVGNLSTAELAPGMTIAGGMFGCNGTVRNCILWGNTPDSMFGTQYSSMPTPPDYCCAQGGVKDFFGQPAGTGNIDLDPLFVDPLGEDYHLRSDSPCVDAGCAIAGLTEDVDGDSRGVDGCAIARGDGSDFDIGADEYSPAPSRVGKSWPLYR